MSIPGDIGRSVPLIVCADPEDVEKELGGDLWRSSSTARAFREESSLGPASFSAIEPASPILIKNPGVAHRKSQLGFIVTLSRNAAEDC